MTVRSQHQLHHLGRFGELVPIILLNLVYQMLTLGLYRFWAITNIRRYLWARTLFNDDPLEYTGTGKELFLGFLLAAVVVLVPVFALQYGLALANAAGETALAVVFGGLYGLLIVMLTPIALYRARRYRLNRTVWRGMRWGQSGSAMIYALLTLWYGFLTVVTLGLAYPWQSIALERYRLGHTYFGNQPIGFDGTGRALFGRWLKAWAPTVGVILAFGLFAVTRYGQQLSVASENDDAEALGLIIGLGMLALVPMMLVMAMVFCWYKAAELRYIAGQARYQELRFTCTVTGGQLAWLVIGNMLVRIVTLGLGGSYTLVRTARLMARTLSAEGAVDFDRVRQNPDERTRTGEGLAAALSMGEF